MKQKIQPVNRGSIWLHIVAWVIIFSLPYLLRYNYDDRIRNDPESGHFLFVSLLTGIFWVITFYLNAFLLTPRLIYRKRYLLYGLVLLLLFLAIMLVHGWIFEAFISIRPFIFANSVIFNLPTFLLTIAASIAYRVLTDKSEADRLEQQKQEETLKTELSFLRSQISPHFVFNILNNITALARLKSDALEPTVMKLSSLMRYMLYETNEEKVSLLTETEYLQSYIDLQQQRFGAKVAIHTSLDTSGMEGMEIEPMLLIPFVENAFKHGVGLIPEPGIDVALCLQDSTLVFTVANKYRVAEEEIKDRTSGIGLTNVKRRLNLLYHGNHSLSIKREDGWFLVTLHVNLR